MLIKTENNKKQPAHLPITQTVSLLLKPSCRLRCWLRNYSNQVQVTEFQSGLPVPGVICSVIKQTVPDTPALLH